jgi:hypothetical protein
MIEYLVIMRQNGSLLYSKIFGTQPLQTEEDILIGFFASTANFSKEALQSMVEDVNLGMGKRLILVSSSREKILAAAIVSITDNRDLIKLILDQFLNHFVTKYQPHFQNIDQGACDKIISGILESYTVKFSAKRVFLSWLAQGFLGTIGFGLVTIFTQIAFVVFGISANFQNLFAILLIATIDILILFPLPIFISANIVGRKKNAIINFILYWIYITILLFTTPQALLIIYGYFPVIIIIGIAFGWLGLNNVNKKKLWI